MDLKAIASETVRIVEKGEYVLPSGGTVSFGAELAWAVRGTVLYRPRDLDALGVGPRIQETLRRRAQHVLRVAAHQGHRTLVLGAWGCGVFRNDPREVAESFARALDALSGYFERVVFAVYERGGDGPNLRAFRERWG